MRSTIDIDEGLLQQAMDLTGVRTKREIVNLAVRELVRCKRIEQLIARGGSGCVIMTLRRAFNG